MHGRSGLQDVLGAPNGHRPVSEVEGEPLDPPAEEEQDRPRGLGLGLA
jgi:hypothetical protein